MKEVVPVPGIELERDEGIRADTSLEKLAGLKPAFVEDGTVTAGNTSPLNDGAAMLLLGSEAAAERIGDPAAWPGSSPAASTASIPTSSASHPVEAANKALARAGIGWEDIDFVELNEAFASQSLACLAGLARARSGEGQHARRGDRDRPPARRLGRARRRPRRVNELRASGGGYGLATLCIGVGQGLAIVIEA